MYICNVKENKYIKHISRYNLYEYMGFRFIDSVILKLIQYKT